LYVLGSLSQFFRCGRSLLTVTDKTDEHGGCLEVWGHLHLINREKPHLLDIQFTPQKFANFSPEKLGHPLDTPTRGRW